MGNFGWLRMKRTKYILQAKNVVKKFGDKTIVDGISLDLKHGEYVSIRGRSGSGKSTLLKTLCGLFLADGGEIFVDGYDVINIDGEQKSKFRSQVIGIVFQENNLLPDFNVRDNILTPVFVARKKVDKEYYNKLLDMVGLTEHEYKMPHQLSGGMQQRCAIARALIAKPKIIFADEPTGSLDSKTEAEIIKLFKQVNSELKTTILQVTHSKACVSASTRVIKINDGRIVSEE